MQRLCTLWFHLAWQVHCSTNLQSVGRSLHKWIPHPWAKTVTCVTCEVEAAKITSLKLQPAPPQLWIFKTEKIDAEICKPLVSGNNDFEKRKSGLAEKNDFEKTKTCPATKITGLKITNPALPQLWIFKTGKSEHSDLQIPALRE